MQAEIICNMGNKNCFAIMSDKWSFSFENINHLFREYQPSRTSLHLSPQIYKYIGRLRWYFPDNMPDFFSFAQMPAFCLFQFIVFICEALKTHVKYYSYISQICSSKNYTAFQASPPDSWLGAYKVLIQRQAHFKSTAIYRVLLVLVC